MGRRRVPVATLALVALATVAVFAPGTAGADDAEAAAQANNPLADFRAFNVHNYYIGSLSELGDATANTAWMRYAQPMFGSLFRLSLPISRVPTGAGTTVSGLGDLNAFLAYLVDTGNPALSFGVGPQLTLPTASETETGTEKWQGGAAVVIFDARSPTVQYGGLITWQASFAGEDTRADTNLLAVQPFYFFQAGAGLYFRGAPIWVFDLENDRYHVPLGLGVGKVIPAGNIIYNCFVETQYTILDDGAGQPETQLFLGVNMQFKT
jgi:hypothetical protein